MPEQPPSDESPFPPATEAMWRAAAIKALGGRSPDELISQTRDGIPVLPVYPDRANGPRLPTRPGRWSSCHRIDDPGLSVADIAALRGRVSNGDGVELVFTGSPTARGRGVPLELPLVSEAISTLGKLRIDCGIPPADIFALLHQKTRDDREAPIVVLDPIGLASGLAGAADTSVRWDAASDLCRGGQGVAVADGRVWHTAGATEAEELAAVVAGLIGWLRAAESRGLAPEMAWVRTSIVLVATPDVFVSIAKLRAARILLDRVLSGFAGHSDMPGQMTIHAETSWRRTASRESELNLLRSAAAAFAAIAGGADSLTVLPFDHSALAGRLAANTTHLLGREAMLGAIADPAAGAGAVEALTMQIAQAAWTMVQEAEAKGGLEVLVREGAWQDRLRRSADAEEAAVRRGDIVLVGANRYVTEAGPAAPGFDGRIGNLAADAAAT